MAWDKEFINNSDMTMRISLFLSSSQGLSGRVLRKIPFLAHAVYIQVGNK